MRWTTALHHPDTGSGPLETSIEIAFPFDFSLIYSTAARGQSGVSCSNVRDRVHYFYSFFLLESHRFLERVLEFSKGFVIFVDM